MRFLFVMDAMDRILPDKDTTFAFQRAAQRRGDEVLHCLVSDLLVRDGETFASAASLRVSDNAPYYQLGPSGELPLSALDAVWIRKDPPFDAQYLYATLLLERARGKTLLMNDPRGLREANEKLYTLHFAEHMPRTIVAAGADRLFAFLDQIGGRGVIKPLDGAGGAGVMLLDRNDLNARAIVETLTSEGRRLAMLQEFLPNVRKGDKRVLLLDGEVLGAINRVPRADDLRSNIHVGGQVEPTSVTEAERRITSALGQRLREDGLVFVGLDLIDGRLTEVNVTSPTGIQEMSRFAGRDLAEDVVAWVEKASTRLRSGA